MFLWSPINHDELYKTLAILKSTECLWRNKINFVTGVFSWILLQISSTKTVENFQYKNSRRSSVVMSISEFCYAKISDLFYSSYFLENIFSKHLRSNLPVDKWPKSNVHKMFMSRPVSQINALRLLNLDSVFTDIKPQDGKIFW